MAALLGKMKNSYDFVFYDLADERSKDISPAPWILLVVMPFYIYFSLNLGPRLMQDYKPFKLKTPIFFFNIIQILLCAYTIFLGFKGGWLGQYDLKCQPVDKTENLQSRAMLNGVWLYTILKFTDLLDTVFFVLRKKDRQISTLHVFHHTLMPCAAFICLRYFPNGHGTFVGLLNSIIHVIMYTYYLIAGLGPKYQKYLWWKKHLTTMQIFLYILLAIFTARILSMLCQTPLGYIKKVYIVKSGYIRKFNMVVQFSLIFVHNVVALSDSTCDYPKWISWLLCINSLIFMYMFGNFYYVNYIKSHKQTKKYFKKSIIKEQ